MSLGNAQAYQNQESIPMPDLSYDTYMNQKYGFSSGGGVRVLDSLKGWLTGDNFTNWQNQQWNYYNAQVEALNQKNGSMLGQTSQAEQAGYNPSAALSSNSSYGLGSAPSIHDSRPTDFSPLDVMGQLIQFAQIAGQLSSIKANIDQNKANTALTQEKTRAQQIQNDYARRLAEANLNRILATTGNLKGKTYMSLFPRYYSQFGHYGQNMYYDDITGLTFNFDNAFRNIDVQKDKANLRALRALTSVRNAETKTKNYYLKNIADQMKKIYEANANIATFNDQKKENLYKWNRAGDLSGIVNGTLGTILDFSKFFTPTFGASVNGDTGVFSQTYSGFRPYGGGF